MRFLVIVLGFVLVGCSTTTKNEPKPPLGLSVQNLSPGECGLYVWTADPAKTFTLFAAPSAITYLNAGKEIPLSEQSPTTPPAQSRKFLDAEGKTIMLTLLSPEEIKGGTRYKAGRLTSQSEDGWETIVPVVGLYACQSSL